MPRYRRTRGYIPRSYDEDPDVVTEPELARTQTSIRLEVLEEKDKEEKAKPGNAVPLLDPDEDRVLQSIRPVLRKNESADAQKLVYDAVVQTEGVDAVDGKLYRIAFENPETPICVDVKVDGQRALAPIWARASDGSKRWQKKRMLPVRTSKPRYLPGFQLGFERTETTYGPDYKRFKFEKLDAAAHNFRAAEFPALVDDVVSPSSTAGATEGPVLPDHRKAGCNGDAGTDDASTDVDADSEAGGVPASAPARLWGGFIEVRVYELVMIYVRNRSKKGGEFCDKHRPIGAAAQGLRTVPVGSLRTVPNKKVEPDLSEIGNRNSDIKWVRGDLIRTHVIYYGEGEALEERALAATAEDLSTEEELADDSESESNARREEQARREAAERRRARKGKGKGKSGKGKLGKEGAAGQGDQLE